jgi:NUMOD4 motif/HNH endonuclease
MTERWLPIVGFEGLYEVSDLGRVRSLGRVDSLGRKWSRQLLRLGIAGRGYAKVDLRKQGKYAAVYVHTAVLTAFIGPKPPGHECAHKDGGLRNNRLSNLAWKTHRENEADKVRHGTKLIREKHWNWQGGISL